MNTSTDLSTAELLADIDWASDEHVSDPLLSIASGAQIADLLFNNPSNLPFLLHGQADELGDGFSMVRVSSVDSSTTRREAQVVYSLSQLRVVTLRDGRPYNLDPDLVRFFVVGTCSRIPPIILCSTASSMNPRTMSRYLSRLAVNCAAREDDWRIFNHLEWRLVVNRVRDRTLRPILNTELPSVLKWRFEGSTGSFGSKTPQLLWTLTSQASPNAEVQALLTIQTDDKGVLQRNFDQGLLRHLRLPVVPSSKILDVLDYLPIPPPTASILVQGAGDPQALRAALNHQTLAA